MNKAEIYAHVAAHNEAAKKCIADNNMDGYIIGTFLHGSQNYNLDTDESDVDTISIFVPSCNYAIIHRPENKCHIMDDEMCAGEHCNIKDIRNWVNEILKSNPNAIEILFTDYFICEDNFNWFKNKPLDYFYVNLDNFLAAANGCANQYLSRKNEKGLKGYHRIIYTVNRLIKYPSMSTTENPYRLSDQARSTVFYYAKLASEKDGLFDFMDSLKNEVMREYKPLLESVKVDSVFKEKKKEETIEYMLGLIKEV